MQALAATSVGLLAVGYWAKDLDVVRDFLSSSFFKATEQDAIMAIADTILPRGDQPYGALDLGVPIYLIDYLQSCVESDVIENAKMQIQQIDVFANEQHNKDFNDCTQDIREEILRSLLESENEEVKSFFQLMKEQTIHGFRTSEKVLTNHFDYKVMPGAYDGCFAVNSETVI